MSYDNTCIGFITDPLELEDKDKHVEVADDHHVTAKKKEQAQIKMCDDKGDSFIVKLYNVLLAPYICDGLF